MAEFYYDFCEDYYFANKIKKQAKDQKILKKCFGENEYGMINLIGKISNVRLSRIVNYKKVGGCPFCFPHGFETTNSTNKNAQRCWKKQRKTQWK